MARWLVYPAVNPSVLQTIRAGTEVEIVAELPPDKKRVSVKDPVKQGLLPETFEVFDDEIYKAPG